MVSKAHKPILKLPFIKILVFLGILVFGCFAISWTFIKIGDSIFASGNLEQAKVLYKISSLFNPFSPNLQSRLLAIDIQHTWPNIHSEETDINDNNSTFSDTSIDKQVLGVSSRVPVLMYHYIRINPDPKDILGISLSVTPDNFNAQMDYLSSHGYHTISLDELGGVMFYHASLPSKPIVITFDDGYADLYTAAYPILKAHGFKGVSFVITGVVGAPRYLNWDQINEMKNSGVLTFEAHTVTHRPLVTLDDATVTKEVTESKAILQSHLGYPINWFAYPYGNGAFSARVRNLIQKAGFVGAFGTPYGLVGLNSNLYALPRVRIDGRDNLQVWKNKFP